MADADMALTTPRDDLEIRTLASTDAQDVAQLVGNGRFTLDILTKELSSGDRYRWVGAQHPDGRLAGAHRALQWGDYLFLKGVFVDPAARGSSVALRLAFEARKIARQEGKRGIAAWISASSPAQVALARRLRLKETGPPLHLYALPVTDTGLARALRPPHAMAKVEEILLKYLTHAADRALVPDLLVRSDAMFCGLPKGGSACASVHGARRRTASSLPDRHHLLLSSLPCANPGQVAALLDELAPFAGALMLSAVEIPVPATDIMLALWLAGHNARRISKRPVHIGRFDFEQQRENHP